MIPALCNLTAEGASRDEAMQNAERAAADYLSKVELSTINIALPQEQAVRAGSPGALLKELEMFACDEDALREHFAEIARERRREHEEAQLQDSQ